MEAGENVSVLARERRRLMEAWAAYCEETDGASNARRTPI
jgi:hypothetical protein